MRIAFIGQKGIPAKNGGVERHVEFLSIQLNRLGHEVLVYNRSGYTPDKLKDLNGIKLIYKPFIDQKNLANITHTFFSSLDVLRRQPDIIHFHGVGPSLLLWIPKIFCPRAKLVATLHSFDYDNDKWSKFAKMMLRWGERIMFSLADSIIVLTPATQEYARRRYNRETFLIPNGTELGYNQSEATLKFWGLEKNGYIFSSSRLIKLKGLQYLIPAFKNLKTDKKLVIAGDGEYENELKNLAQGDNRIRFINNQSGDALRQLYAHAYLFVQTSEMEGLSLSLLEAMGHRTACLASDIDGNKEALRDTGFYFQSRNVNDLEQQMKYVLENPEVVSQKAQAAYERACKEYDWQKIAEKTATVYQNASQK